MGFAIPCLPAIRILNPGNNSFRVTNPEEQGSFTNVQDDNSANEAYLNSLLKLLSTIKTYLKMFSRKK
ncbi:hypothetical protein D0T56_04015 [Dysgonomonas sp. 520]|nr:hypothetical protein [Dysgonomonas sp. 520]